MFYYRKNKYIPTKTLEKNAEQGDFYASLTLVYEYLFGDKRTDDETSDNKAVGYLTQSIKYTNDISKIDIASAYAFLCIAYNKLGNLQDAATAIQTALTINDEFFIPTAKTVLRMSTTYSDEQKQVILHGLGVLLGLRTHLGFEAYVINLTKAYQQEIDHKKANALFDVILLSTKQYCEVTAPDNILLTYFLDIANKFHLDSEKVKYWILLARFKVEGAISKLIEFYSKKPEDRKQLILFVIYSISLCKSLDPRELLDFIHDETSPQDTVFALVACYYFCAPHLTSDNKDLYRDRIKKILWRTRVTKEGTTISEISGISSNDDIMADPSILLKAALKIDPYATRATVSYCLKYDFINSEQVEFFNSEILGWPRNKRHVYLKDKLHFTFLAKRGDDLANLIPQNSLMMSVIALKISNPNFNGQKQIGHIRNLIIELIQQDDCTCILRATQLWEKFKSNKLLYSVELQDSIKRCSQVIQACKLEAISQAFDNFKAAIPNSLVSQSEYQELIGFLDNIITQASSNIDKNLWLDLGSEDLFYADKYEEFDITVRKIINSTTPAQDLVFNNFMQVMTKLQNSLDWIQNTAGLFNLIKNRLGQTTPNEPSHDKPSSTLPVVMI